MLTEELIDHGAQVLTDPSYFDIYTQQIGLIMIERGCTHCGEVDTMEHTLFHEMWGTCRQQTPLILGYELNSKNLRTMVEILREQWLKVNKN